MANNLQCLPLSAYLNNTIMNTVSLVARQWPTIYNICYYFHNNNIIMKIIIGDRISTLMLILILRRRLRIIQLGGGGGGGGAVGKVSQINTHKLDISTSPCFASPALSYQNKYMYIS